MWSDFWQVSRFRTERNALRPRDLLDFEAIRGRAWRRWELRALQAMDAAFLDQLGTETRQNDERRKAIKGKR